MSEPKYAPANSDGLKPWLVEVYEWGDTSEHIVYADTRSQAAYEAKGQMLYVTAKARRATPDDVARLSAAVPENSE